MSPRRLRRPLDTSEYDAQLSPPRSDAIADLERQLSDKRADDNAIAQAHQSPSARPTRFPRHAANARQPPANHLADARADGAAASRGVKLTLIAPIPIVRTSSTPSASCRIDRGGCPREYADLRRTSSPTPAASWSLDDRRQRAGCRYGARWRV
ncbi:MAG: hypothetical protein ACLTDR_08465 [Adlercreutzia equolifaciens]